MRFAAGLALAATLAGGCFPDNPRARHISYAAEVASMVAGGAVLAIAKPAGDCLQVDTACRDRGDRNAAIGLTLLFGGIIGAVVTIVTAEDGGPVTTKTRSPAPAPAPQ